MTNQPDMARILVIDDDKAIRSSLRILLGRRGFEVIEAGTGAEGLARFREHRPQIVMCDMVMPGGEGVDTIARIRDADAEVAIIAMSGSIQGGANGFLVRALAAGANRCLEKPFETSELFVALEKRGDE